MAALCARGRLRALRDLRAIPGFGRRHQTRLRQAFADPGLSGHLTAALESLTHRPAAIPEVVEVIAHPFGETAWFPPTVARLLGQDGRLLYGQPRPLPGFGFCAEIIGFAQAAILPAPRRGVVIGGGYVGVEVALAWAEAGAAVALLTDQEALLIGYEAEAVVAVLARLAAAGVAVWPQTRALRWQQVGAGVEVVVQPAEGGEVVLPAERVLVAVGLIYPRQRSGRRLQWGSG